ncbi:MAG: hypothetical protein CMH47_16655 [Muricauda sp.]|nr:hypothetical protein [Allomuricauda sp.]
MSVSHTGNNLLVDATRIFPKLVPTWEFWFSGVSRPHFSHFHDMLRLSRVQNTPKPFKFYVKKIVPKLVPTWDFFPKSFFRFVVEPG